jgi:hypothetical protein
LSKNPQKGSRAYSGNRTSLFPAFSSKSEYFNKIKKILHNQSNSEYYNCNVAFPKLQVLGMASMSENLMRSIYETQD